MRRLIFSILLLLAFRAGPAAGADAVPPSPGIDWQEWTPAIFDRAKAEKKIVLLDLHAVWCHWCHVMQAETYCDPKVIELIRSNFIAVGVNQDSRPDLANRYEDYGWPATVIFAANGSELVKRRGFIPPREMAALLQAVIDDPTPGPSIVPEPVVKYSADSALSGTLRKELREQLIAGYDRKNGSWGTAQKFLDWDNVEYCLTQAQAGDARFEKMARQTLAAQGKLLDPAWGGVYQYSTDGDWDHPHFEKLMQFQAENLRVYALAFALWKDERDAQTAEKIHRYVRDFLTSPDGAFYTSQDADVIQGFHAGEYFKLDDAARRKQGLPRVDKHIYSRENGWMISALAQAYAATGGGPYLQEALVAADYIRQNRSMPSGGWRHDFDNEAGPYLGDALAMGCAFLDLYSSTGDRNWLDRAEDTANFMIDRFTPPGNNPAGVVTTAVSGANLADPKPQWDENVGVARFANLLFHYDDNKQYRQFAECAMRYLATPEIALPRRAFVGGLLLADLEMNTEPLHIVVVGRKDDPAAKKLFTAAVRYPAIYKQIEWQDRREEPLHKDTAYPALPQAAAFICANNTCSSPIFKAEELAPRVEHLLNKTKSPASN